tara:strand:+ start:652 stop:807 length:156 start_codon:yes stop_codon:yes gene_type:complete
VLLFAFVAILIANIELLVTIAACTVDVAVISRAAAVQRFLPEARKLKERPQ